MLKSISLALVGLVATASAVEINPFNAVNFVHANTPMVAYKTLLEKIQGHNVQDGDLGHVTWTKCDSDVKAFVVDFSQTYNDPDPAVKGSDVALILGGIFNQATEVTNAGIYVLWGPDGTPGVPLHKEDHPLSQKVAANGPFTYNLSWPIPSFAPSGHYHVTITLSGKVGSSTTAQSVGCLNADFDL
jgi:hypothetical protein